VRRHRLPKRTIWLVLAVAVAMRVLALAAPPILSSDIYRYVWDGRVQPWDWTHGERRGWPGHTNVAVDLAEALQRNTHLQVLLNSGIYDLATPYYAAEYTMDHLELPKELRDHIQIVEYDAGHMMYVHPPSLAKLKKSIASFIDRTSGARGGATVAGGR
jgi:carboxypeptidase C (cathepsin A)